LVVIPAAGDETLNPFPPVVLAKAEPVPSADPAAP
jgi:hypothetical protein